MKKILFSIFMISGILSFTTLPAKQKQNDFPVVKQHGKTAVVAHRGFWKGEQGGFSENSLAALKAAQDCGFWGSECDIHLTADNQVIVNHNHDIDGLVIAEHNFDKLSAHKLPNGECRPSFKAYAAQAAKCRTTMLVVEFKIQPSKEKEDRLVEEAVAILKENGIFTPQRVLFISFSQHICEYIAQKYPKFINQFLTDDKKNDMHPSQFAEKGINGIDYKYRLFSSHPEWISEARECGMSVNSWTVNSEKDIREMIELGVDAITSNEPLRVRMLLGDKEFRK